MDNYLKKKATKHKVTHEFSGRKHFFNVESISNKKYNVSIEVGCDCTYMAVQGITRGGICSHVLAVFEDIIKHGNIRLTTGKENMLQMKRNVCMNLVRPANRVLNEIRVSSGESPEHQDKKIEICKRLQAEGKHFLTEAIFITGGRADILVLDNFKVIEIVKTESNESIMRKQEKYPDGITIEVERC